MGAGTKLSPAVVKNADGVPVRGAASAARSCVVIATDDIGLAGLRISQPAFDVRRHRVDHVLELWVARKKPGDHGAYSDDSQPGIAGDLQCFIDENRCETASFELVSHLGMREDALAIAVRVLGEAGRLAFDGDGEAVGFGRHGGRGSGFVGGHGFFYTPGLRRGRSVALGRGGAGRRDTFPWYP